VVVVPVARAMLGAGAGFAQRLSGAETGEGGGGGAMAVPVGYIEVRKGRASFQRIHGPLAPWIIPAVLIALIGVRAARRSR
jgi:uncharacterized spore protein YtfJ